MLSELAWFENQLKECGVSVPRDVRVSERSSKKKKETKVVMEEANFNASLPMSPASPESPDVKVNSNNKRSKDTPSPQREPGRGSRKKKTSLKKLENWE